MGLRSLDRRAHIIVDPACSQKTARCATDQTLDWTGRISQARLVALSEKGVTAVFVGGAIVGAGAVALVDALTGSDSEPGLQAAKKASPDTPPAEFAYLVTAAGSLRTSGRSREVWPPRRHGRAARRG